MKLSEIINKLRPKSLQSRFLFRVLTPPFLVLLAISVVGFWILERSVYQSASQEIIRAVSTSSAKLEREIALRKTVLTTTGNELFNTKTSYQQQHKQLKKQYTTCRDHIAGSYGEAPFLTAPDNACDPFLAEFARLQGQGNDMVLAVQQGYEKQAKELNASEQKDIGNRLDAFSKFFPETLALYVTDKNGNIISQADNSQFSLEPPQVEEFIKQAKEHPVEGASLNGNRQAVFAYPIDNGAVLAAYNLDHPKFIQSVYNEVPIDTSKAYAVVTNPDNTLTYPEVEHASLYEHANKNEPNILSAFSSNGIDYLGASEQTTDSNWHVIVGSPAAIVLEPVKNAQIAALIIIGLLLVSFLWMGAIFVRRTVSSIIMLTGGALIFASNKLDYRIDTSKLKDDEFTKLAETLNHMAGRIQEAEHAIDQKNKEFINIATHELKAPMTAIIGYLSMVLDEGVGTLDKQAREMTSKAYEGTERLRDLVSDLLDIARLESGRAKFDTKPLDITKETDDMIEIQKLPAQQKQITIDHRSTEKLPRVMADQNKLQIILTNFISNAIKYNRSPGTVTITHSVDNDYVTTSIADSGLGIPKEQQDKMFQKFFRVEGEDRKGIPGTGLGMYVTKQFIEAMGGSLRFDSAEGKGTTFHFTLPIENEASADRGKEEIDATTPAA